MAVYSGDIRQQRQPPNKLQGHMPKQELTLQHNKQVHVQWDCLVHTLWAFGKQYTTTLCLGVHGGMVCVRHEGVCIASTAGCRSHLENQSQGGAQTDVTNKPMREQ